VKPGPERPHAVRPAGEETPPPNPGDLICGNCGIGNDPARRFCRRCGLSLASATVAAPRRVPWWRRIFGGGRPKARMAAGERPKSMRSDGRTTGGIRPARLLSAAAQIVIIAAVVGAVSGYFVVPSWRSAVNGFLDSIKEIVVPAANRVYTSGPTTGPGVKDHPASKAWDGSLAFWAAPVTASSPATIESAFIPPADINKVLVTAGAAGAQYTAFARPRDVTIQLLDADGAVIVSKDLELKQQPEPQAFDVGGKDASRVRLIVRSVYPAADASAPMALTEVEFFGSQAGAGPSSTP